MVVAEVERLRSDPAIEKEFAALIKAAEAGIADVCAQVLPPRTSSGKVPLSEKVCFAQCGVPGWAPVSCPSTPGLNDASSKRDADACLSPEITQPACACLQQHTGLICDVPKDLG